MNTFKTLLGVSVLVAAASAHAAIYDIHGSLTAWSTPPAPATYPDGVPTFTGTLDDTTGAYTFNFNTFREDQTYNFGPPNIFFVEFTRTGQVFTGTGNSVVTRTTTNIGCTGAAFFCNNVPTAPILGTLAFSVSGSTITGTLNTSQATQDPNPAWTGQYSFTGTVVAPTVPVPAAAWLFGSGLIGLAGTARRRTRAM